MAITRIKNNQITDATIIGSAKLVDNSVTSGKLEDNLTYGSNLTVTGNLTVNGTSTTVNSTTVTVDDPLLLLAPDQSGSGALDIGILGERGDDTNIALIWDESADEFVAAFTSSTDSSTTITVTDYADFHVGGLTVDDGATLSSTLNVVGDFSVNTNKFNVTASSGNTTVAGTLGVTGAVTANAGVTIDNINIDGTTIALSTGDLTLDVAGDIILDADGGDVTLADAGTTYGALTQSGGELVIKSGSTPTAAVTLSGANATLAGTLDVTGATNINSTTGSTSTSSGALIVDGGVGIAENAYVGGNIVVTGNLTVNGTTTTVNSTVTTVADPIMTFGQNDSDDNKDRGIEFKYNDGTAKIGFFGFDDSAGTFTALLGATNSSEVFSGTAAPAIFGNVNGATGTFDDLSIGGGYGSTGVTVSSAGAISANGAVTIDGLTSADGGIDVNSANFAVATSGRVTSVEDIAITADSKNLEIGASADFTITHNGTDSIITNSTGILAIDGAASSAIRINEAGADVDTVIEGDTDTNLFVADAGADVILIGTATATTGAKLKVGTTDSMIVPVGTTLQRPGTGAAGMVRFNTTVGYLEYHTGTDWQSAASDFTVIASETFDGDGSTVAFTLQASYTTASVIVSINGVVQLPTTAYGVSSTTLTFTEAPASGDKIEVRELTTTSTIASIDDGTGAATINANADATIDILGDVQLTAQGDLRFMDSDSSNYVAFQAPGTVSSNVTWTLPSADAGTSGYALVSDGAGTLSWAAAGATISQDNTTNTAFNLYYAATTSGALTAVKYDGGTLTFNPSTETLACTNFSGTATSAQYADLAEKYSVVEDIEPGTVVCFGGEAEVQVCDHDMDRKIAGVVSTDPAYMMNAGAEGVYVALTGRVPCKVVGPVSKGDMMVSAGNGRARAEENPVLGSVIGKALENFDGDEGVIEVVVGRL